jgi:transcriptional regulator with XRE-family HTH domain
MGMVTKYDASRIKLAREANGLTQDELARTMGTQKQQISAWESGRVGISVRKLVEVSNILGTPTAFFFTRVDEVDTSSPEAA